MPTFVFHEKKNAFVNLKGYELSGLTLYLRLLNKQSGRQLRQVIICKN